MATNNGRNNKGQFPIGSIVRLDFTPPAGSGWLSCDGSVLLQSDYAALYAVIADEYIGSLTLTAVTDADSGGTNIGTACWHPDGNYICAGDQSNYIKVYSFDGTTLTEVESINLGAYARSTSWSHSGTYVAVGSTLSSEQLKVYSWNPSTEELTIVDTYNVGDVVNSVEWNHNDTYIIVACEMANKQVSAYGFNGSTLTQSANYDTGVDAFAARWSSDSSQVAIGLESSANKELRVLSWNGSNSLSKIADLEIGGLIFELCWSVSEDYIFTAGNVATKQLAAYSWNGTNTLAEVETVNIGLSGYGVTKVNNNIIFGTISSASTTEYLKAYVWDEGAETLTYNCGITTTSKGNLSCVSSPNGAYIVSSAYEETDVTINLYSTATCNSEVAFKLPTSADHIIRSS